MRDASLDSKATDIVAEDGRDFLKLGTQITLHADGRVFGRFAEAPVEAQQLTQTIHRHTPTVSAGLSVCLPVYLSARVVIVNFDTSCTITE